MPHLRLCRELTARYWYSLANDGRVSEFNVGIPAPLRRARRPGGVHPNDGDPSGSVGLGIWLEGGTIDQFGRLEQALTHLIDTQARHLEPLLSCGHGNRPQNSSISSDT